MRIRGLLFLLVSLSFVFNSCTDNQESIIGFDENYSVAQETGLFYRLDDEKLIEHAKIEGASFIVFMDSSYVSKARVLLPEANYFSVNKALRTFYSSILEEHGIPVKNLGLVFNNFNGFEVSLNEEELRLLQNSRNINSIEINHKFNAQLPTPEKSKTLLDGTMPFGIENNLFQSTDIIPPGVALVWSTNQAYQADASKTVWILDTGVDLNHPDLNVDTTRDVSFVASEPSADDLQRHGTHVAGIIGAKRNNLQIVGVAPNARIVPVKVLDQNGGG